MVNKIYKMKIKSKKISKSILKKREQRRIKRENKLKFKEFVKKIKERDNYTCQISGKYLKDADPRALPMVHVLSKENYPSLKMDENNVLCLSFYHHKNSPLSPHLDGFVFVDWFKHKFPLRYKYLMRWLRKWQDN